MPPERVTSNLCPSLQETAVPRVAPPGVSGPSSRSGETEQAVRLGSVGDVSAMSACASSSASDQLKPHTRHGSPKVSRPQVLIASVATITRRRHHARPMARAVVWCEDPLRPRATNRPSSVPASRLGQCVLEWRDGRFEPAPRERGVHPGRSRPRPCCRGRETRARRTCAARRPHARARPGHGCGRRDVRRTPRPEANSARARTC